MKNRIFTVKGKLFGLALLSAFLVLTFSSCSDIFGGSGSTGEVSFSLKPEAFKSALQESARDILKNETDTNSEYQYVYEKFENVSYTMEISLKGEYEDSVSQTWNYEDFKEYIDAEKLAEEYENVTEPQENENNFYTLFAKVLAEGSEVTFEKIPTNKKIYAECKFSYTETYETQYTESDSYTNLLFHGKSEEKSISSGQNSLTVTIFNAYAQFPFEVTMEFPEGTDIASVISNYPDFRVYMRSPDSTAIKNIQASSDDLSLYEAANSIYSEGRSAEYENICPESDYDYETGVSNPKNYTITGTTLVVTSSTRIPVSISDKNKGNEVAMIPAAFKWDGNPKAKYVGTEVKTVTPSKNETTKISFTVKKLDVTDTNYVLYNKGTDDYGNPSYQYYLTYNPAQTEFPSDTSSDSFCFDADGNLYTLNGAEVKSTNSEFGNSGTISWSQDDLPIYYIAIDRKTGVLYGLSYGKKIYKLDSSDGTVNTETIKSLAFENAEGNCLGNVRGLSVYDGVAYVTTYFNEGGEKIVYLYIVPLSAMDDPTGETVRAEEVPLFSKKEGEDFHDNADVTDILYQDGFVYVLFRDCTFEGSTDYVGTTIYGRGCLIKYDLTEKKVETLGWTSEGRTPTDKYIYAVSGSDTKLYDEDGKVVLIDKEPETTFYTIDCTKENYLSQKSFYGPRKFIAIKPKKLVIADDGYAFYTDSLSGYRYKNVNRIVNVDLEAFAIKEEPEEIAATFSTECSSQFLKGSGFYTCSFKSSESSPYYTNLDAEGKGTGSSYNLDTLNLGFLKDEE